jgi:hypothetical protein
MGKGEKGITCASKEQRSLGCEEVLVTVGRLRKMEGKIEKFPRQI